MTVIRVLTFYYVSYFIVPENETLIASDKIHTRLDLLLPIASHIDHQVKNNIHDKYFAPHELVEGESVIAKHNRPIRPDVATSQGKKREIP